MVRGVRNKNLGNIRISRANWLGKIPVSQNTDKSFEQFTDLKFGTRALIKNLQTYFKQGNNTVSKIINKWAPTSENDTNAYIAMVCKFINVTPNQKLEPTEDTLIGLARAISRKENGAIHTLTYEEAKEGFKLTVASPVKKKQSS